MKKIISIIVSLFMLSACDVDLSPDFDKMVVNTRVYTVFRGIINGVEYDMPSDAYSCNEVDNYIYRITDNSAVLNSDSTQATCDPYLFTRVETNNTPISMYGGN